MAGLSLAGAGRKAGKTSGRVTFFLKNGFGSKKQVTSFIPAGESTGGTHDLSFFLDNRRITCHTLAPAGARRKNTGVEKTSGLKPKNFLISEVTAVKKFHFFPVFFQGWRRSTYFEGRGWNDT